MTLYVPEGISVIRTPFTDGERKGVVLVVTDGEYTVNTEPYFPCVDCGTDDAIEDVAREMVACVEDMRRNPTAYFDEELS